MRGHDEQTTHMFSYLSPEQRVPADHPLRAVRALTDEALQTMSRRFASLYATTGRPSIPPEQLLRALLLQVLYTVRSERLLMEELTDNLLFRSVRRAEHAMTRSAPSHDVDQDIVTGCCRAMSPPRSLMRSRPTPGWPGCLHFGYLNRNHREQPNVPIGPNNYFSPGDQDREQPTYFYPRTHRYQFSVRVPADMGTSFEDRLVWTVTHNGSEQQAIGWLKPEWEIEVNTITSNLRTGFGRSKAELYANASPTVTVEAAQPTVTVGEPLTLTAVLTDDELPTRKPPRGERRNRIPSLGRSGRRPQGLLTTCSRTRSLRRRGTGCPSSGSSTAAPTMRRSTPPASNARWWRRRRKSPRPRRAWSPQPPTRPTPPRWRPLWRAMVGRRPRSTRR